MHQAENFRLNWRSEFRKLSPYLQSQEGVVRVNYRSENAAPGMFNHLLKEEFVAHASNGPRLSLRIDSDWFTTRVVAGVLDELDRLLGEAGFPAERADIEYKLINFVTENEVQGNMITTVTNNTFNLGSEASAQAQAARLASVCAAMRKFVEAGGHFMVVLNDTPLSKQSVFWQQIWNVGLSDAGRGGLLLVIHAGPKSEQQQHEDSPRASECLYLPDSVESDESRQDHIYDDLIDVFQRNDIMSHEASAAAAAHLANNADSMSKLYSKLGATLMSLKQRLRNTGE